MALVDISEAAAGMVLAKDVFGPSGQCLVSKGAVLSAPLINSLIRHNVAKLHIEDESEKENFTDEEITNAEQACFEKVSERFYAESDDAMMKKIFNTVLRIEAIGHLKCRKKN